MSNRYVVKNKNKKEPSLITIVPNDRTMNRHQSINNNVSTVTTYQRDYNDSPSYYVEHLFTVPVGVQYGLETPQHGLHKLKQMELNSAIWAQPMILRLLPHAVVLEDENGGNFESFAMDLITSPTAHLSSDVRDVYNNVLLFIVKEDQSYKRVVPTEMHLFQCNRVAAADVVDDMSAYMSGRYGGVMMGRRDTGFVVQITDTLQRGASRRSVTFGDSTINTSVSQSHTKEINSEKGDNKHAYGNWKESPKHITNNFTTINNTIVDKEEADDGYGHNLATERNLISDPDELLQFLMQLLDKVMQASRSTISTNIAPQISSPLLTRAAHNLLNGCLSSREQQIWRSLGDTWTIPLEDWKGPMPPQYLPVFDKGFATHYPPRARVKTQPQTNTLNTERNSSIHLLTEKLDRAYDERERKLNDERDRLEHDKRQLIREQERVSLNSQHRSSLNSHEYRTTSRMARSQSATPSPQLHNNLDYETLRTQFEIDSPRQRAFYKELLERHATIGRIIYDRNRQSTQELTVFRGEYVEILSDRENWCECTNVHSRVGFVPWSIVEPLRDYSERAIDVGEQRDPFRPSTSRGLVRRYETFESSTTNTRQYSPRPSSSRSDIPDYIKKRTGKKGEFRYF